MRRPLIRLLAGAIMLAGILGPLGVSAGATVTAHAVSATTSTPLPAWPGTNTQYIGRYHLTASSDPSLATDGELTVFVRIVPRVPKPQLSGILNLNSKNGNNVLYMTMFKHTSTSSWASVNLGIYTGPVLGKFLVTSAHAGKIVAKIVLKGQPPFTLTFVRFSTNPHP